LVFTEGVFFLDLGVLGVVAGSDGVRDDRRIGDDMLLEQDDGPLLGAFVKPSK